MTDFGNFGAIRFDPPLQLEKLLEIGVAQARTIEPDATGFTWEEVHKGAHLWEFGDSGSILVMANDQEATKHILFSTDEGLNWREYEFSDHPMRVLSVVTVPMDTSRNSYEDAYIQHMISIGFSNRWHVPWIRYVLPSRYRCT